MSDTISLLITYYNEKELLTECLESVSRQSILPDEVLIYDDASDFSAENYIPKDINFVYRIIKGETNKGPGESRNILMKESSSEYIHFHDSDDLLKRDMIASIKGEIINHHPDLIINEVSSTKNNKKYVEHVIGLSDLNEHKDLPAFALQRSLLIPAMTYRRKQAVALGGFLSRVELPQSEDFEFHLNLVFHIKSWRLILKPLVIQRLRDISYSHLEQNRKDVYISGFKILRRYSKSLSEKYKDISAERMFMIGANLYRLGYRREAKKAFKTARKTGKVRYANRSFLYKLIARFGSENLAEFLSLWKSKLY